MHKRIDMTNKPCSKKGCSGVYKETTLLDDRDGVLHCTKCNKEIKRYRKR